MKPNTLFSILATAAFGIVMAGPASAADPDPGLYRTQATGNWNASGTWEVFDRDAETWGNAESYPQTGDTATVLNGHDVTLQQDEDVAKLTVDSGGIVGLNSNDFEIANSSGLTVNGRMDIEGTTCELEVSGGGTHTIGSGGMIFLSSSTAGFLISSTATISGAGSVKGEDNSAEFRIAANTVLTSTMSIVGNMKIVGLTPAGPGNAGKLDNRGLVHANETGFLTLDGDLIVVDTGGDVRWKVSSGAFFVFNGAIPCGNLAGNFDLDGCGTFQFNATVYTSGSFTTGDGFVDVNPDDQSVCFNYDCNSGCTICTQVCEDKSYGSCE